MEDMDPDYQKWLWENDVSRPHRSGRWRVRFSDTQTCNMLPYALAVGGYCSHEASPIDIKFFCRWRDSDECRHKQNASGFLRSAKHRHLIDGAGNKQITRVKSMCRHIRRAMLAFAAGEFQAGEASMHEAWGSYILLQFLYTSRFAIKGASFSTGRRKGAKGAFTTLVEGVAKQIGSTNWKDVVTALETVDVVQEVCWDEEKIWLKGEDDPRRFKTVRNILAKM